uniref:Uncharacterized protein n=1 Tax=Tanacetum cinerariifolium TaxID=118510 RepID=A0A699IB09_TANCI|nr:hypothetical protein [Tanacetum cinerariifolium]
MDATCHGANLSQFQLQTKKKHKKVINSTLNENGLDGEDTNNIKRGNAQTAGSSSCDYDIDLDGGVEKKRITLFCLGFPLGGCEFKGTGCTLQLQMKLNYTMCGFHEDTSILAIL